MQPYINRRISRSCVLYVEKKQEDKSCESTRHDVYSNARYTGIYRKFIPKYFPKGLPTIEK